MQFCLDKPYPEVKVDKEDKKLALCILNSYAGRVSEDTAIHNYIFQTLTQNQDQIKKILEGIAIVEMHHLEILGKLIIKLGLKPIFAPKNDNTLSWFSGEFIDYEMNLKEVLLNNIQNERAAIIQYTNIINRTNDLNVRKILNRIIEDEELHIKIFDDLINKISIYKKVIT